MEICYKVVSVRNNHIGDLTKFSSLNICSDNINPYCLEYKIGEETKSVIDIKRDFL